MNDLLHKITPLEVDHIDILDGQVAFVDTSRKERPEIWLHDLQLSVENLTNRVRLTEGRPVLLTASGTLARSGTVSILITADPFEKGLTFSGRAAVVGLETSELYRFIEPATKLQAPQGTIDIFVEFDCRNGELTGGVKPVLKNVKIRPDDKNPFSVLKAWVADLAVKLFSDRVARPERRRHGAPHQGDADRPRPAALAGDLRRHAQCLPRGAHLGIRPIAPQTVEVPPAPPAPAARTSPVRKPQLLAAGFSMTRPSFLDLDRHDHPRPSAAPRRRLRPHAYDASTAGRGSLRPSLNASRRPRLESRSRAPLTASSKTAPNEGSSGASQTRDSCMAGRPKGQLDPKTREALSRFQKHEGLPPTGLPSYETVRHLGLDLDSDLPDRHPSARATRILVQLTTGYWAASGRHVVGHGSLRSPLPYGNALLASRRRLWCGNGDHLAVLPANVADELADLPTVPATFDVSADPAPQSLDADR